jgi:hypothetical protein
MVKRNLVCLLFNVGALVSAAGGAQAATLIPNDPAFPDVRITEFMYKNENSPGEFVQFTNLGPTAVNLAGWSEDDGTGTPGVHALSGILQSGQSEILAQATPASFIAAWNVPSTDIVVQENSSDNLGRSDTINLFDGTNLVDQLTYNDQAGEGPRTDGVAAVPGSASAIGVNDAAGWVLTQVGVNHGIRANGTGDIGSPGFSAFAPVPLPAAAWLLMSGLGALAPTLRGRKQAKE